MSPDAERLAEILRSHAPHRDDARVRLHLDCDWCVLLDALAARDAELAEMERAVELAHAEADLLQRDKDRILEDLRAETRKVQGWIDQHAIVSTEWHRALDTLAARDAELARLRDELQTCTRDGQRMAAHLDEAERELERLREPFTVEHAGHVCTPACRLVLLGPAAPTGGRDDRA